MSWATVRRFGLIGWTGICLFTLLVYTFFHTGALLGEYVRPVEVGYIAAFGIEAGIVGMSIRIGQLMRSQKSAGTWLSLAWQGLTLLFVLLVSAVANVAEGFAVKYGQDFTMAAVSQLDGVQVVVGLLATALIPVVVLSMSEIVSGEVKDALAEPEPAMPSQPARTALPAQAVPRASAVRVSQPAPEPVPEPEPELAQVPCRHADHGCDYSGSQAGENAHQRFCKFKAAEVVAMNGSGNKER